MPDYIHLKPDFAYEKGETQWSQMTWYYTTCDGEAGTQIPGVLEELFSFTNFPRCKRKKPSESPPPLFTFFRLIQAWLGSSWETTGWWFPCTWTRMLTRWESRTHGEMEKSECILIAKSSVYWQQQYEMILYKANSRTDFWDPDSTWQELGGRVIWCNN